MKIKARALAKTVSDRYFVGAANPFAGNSLVPMLVVGLVLTLAGMLAALALS